MTVFIAHAPADQKVAEGLEKFLERRGHFSETDDGSAAMRPVSAADVVLLLLSKDFVFAPARLRLEQRALDAWAEGRLLVVKLDKASIAPVGLRDLPALDASSEAQREFKWNELVNAIRDKLRAPPREQAGEEGAATAPPHTTQAAAKKSGAGPVGLLLAVLLVPGIAALALTVAIWLTNRAAHGSLQDLLASINAFGARYGLPAGLTAPLCGVALLVAILSFAVIVARAVMPAARQARREAAPQAAPVARADAVFVSYARANEKSVLPVIEAAKQAGKRFWLDQQSITPAEGWAGEIVRAIRGAREVLVMCSKAAFESDHVKREIYLADRYCKKLVPVYIEEATPPEDFEYFFAGVQALRLFDTPEADRASALSKALA
jgi:hypothetical protein